MRKRCSVGLVTIAALVVLFQATGAAGATSAVGAQARLIIPRLQLDDPIGSALAFGPAFYPGSARPGSPYTIAIAGHRTTHTHPFWALNELQHGDLITIVWHAKRFSYRVTGSRVVSPTDWKAVADVGHERVILSTCTPRFSARERLIVIALPLRHS